MKFVFRRCAASAAGAFDQLFLLALQHFIRDAAFAIALHQFIQRAARFVFQQGRRQIELNVLVEKFDDLRFLRALDLVFLFVLEIVLEARGANRPAFFSGIDFAAKASSSAGKTFP